MPPSSPRPPGAALEPAAPVMALRGLHKTYRLGRHVVPALRGVDLALHAGEMLALAGPSGSGKSTLLNLCGLVDRPDAGSIHLHGRPVHALDETQATLLRRDALGFVFQGFNLVPVMTAAENVDYPLLLAGVPATGPTHSPAASATAWPWRALVKRPALCFLDIRMPGLAGLEVAQALAEDWPEADAPFPLLVFVTAHDEYALQRLRACGGGLPAQARGAGAAARDAGHAPKHAGFGAAAGRHAGATARPAGAGGPRLQVIQAGGAGSAVHFVPVEDVIYFEAADKYVRVITAEAEHLIRMPLKDLLPQLDPERFWQIHRGTIVQARCIRTAVRDESGKVQLSLRGRPEKLTASRLYAHLFWNF